MSKQRYLLILLLVLAGSCLCGSVLKTDFLAITGDFEPIWLNRSYLETGLEPVKDLQLSFNTRLDAADAPIREFPQNKWLNSQLSLAWKKPYLEMEAAYRNTLFGTSQKLGLYPVYSSSYEYERTAEHQSSIMLNGKLAGLTAGVYGMHRQLRVNPTEYVIDPETWEVAMLEKPQKGLDNVYGGIQAGYQVLPFLALNAFSDLSKANFDGSDTYTYLANGAQADLDYKLSSQARISGSFTWTNRDNQNLSKEAVNLLQSQLRIQHKLLPNLNGYLSFSNNACSDAGLDTLYLISNQWRAHLQYHFSYDPSADSYLLAGVKFSPENESDAIYAEAQSIIVSRLYANLGMRMLPDRLTQYQGKLSYFYTPFSEIHLQYQVLDSETDIKESHYLGLGSSIYF